MSTESFTIRADSETVSRIDSIAARLDRSRNYIVNQAIADYLETQAWQIEKTMQGIASADRGELTPHDDVMAEVAALLTHPRNA
jgi:predicted transcriptional regulator